MRRRGFRITAAANTGPKSEPRPASSRPAMRCQPLCRAVRSNREEQSRRIGADSSIASAHTTRALRREDIWSCLIRSGFFDGRCGGFHGLLRSPNACRLAFELPQVVELGTPHATRLKHFDRTDHRGVDRKNSFHANAKTHTPDGKRCTGKMAAPADHHAFKWLHAFFFPFRFLQPDMHTHGIARAERGDILASLVLTDLLNNATHMDSPGQTRYGGASATEDAVNYNEIPQVCTVQIHNMRKIVNELLGLQVASRDEVRTIAAGFR